MQHISCKGLPLPHALTLHRSLCSQEDVVCANPLLGDKASWISGIVDEVTFCIQTSQITAHLIDGSSVALPITRPCLNMLHRVIEHVQLSFAPPTRPVLEPLPVEDPQGGSSKRITSGLLLTLLSPLLNTGPQPTAPVAPRPVATQNTSRLHRRQARSVLVDAYRRHVLPALKEVLPSSFLLWTVQSEASMKRSEWEATKNEIEQLLEASGHRYATPNHIPTISGSSYLGRSSSAFGDSSPSLGSSSSSSDDDMSTPTTPVTSVWNSRESSTLSPLAHLSSLPASSSVLPSQRPAYASLVSKLAVLASRLSSLKKLFSHVEREDGRRKWLEGMESSRLLERSMRRAASNTELSTSSGIAVGGAVFSPIRRSTLRFSSSLNQDAAPAHSAMEAISDNEGSIADDSMSDVSRDYLSADSDEEKDINPRSACTAIPSSFRAATTRTARPKSSSSLPHPNLPPGATTTSSLATAAHTSKSRLSMRTKKWNKTSP